MTSWNKFVQYSCYSELFQEQITGNNESAALSYFFLVSKEGKIDKNYENDLKMWLSLESPITAE